ncbi:hypothetical protein LINPERPRIM_LOCUS4330, partial [Linum perenne]
MEVFTTVSSLHADCSLMSQLEFPFLPCLHFTQSSLFLFPFCLPPSSSTSHTQCIRTYKARNICIAA